ncbi:MAG: DUF362 domain-containing protein [Candidatus Omnitrophica bacterium]|nr:DUF362 domain-containing protein [Candidatus Omnitrophota bacterium]
MERVALRGCPDYQQESVRQSLIDLLEPFGGVGGLVKPGESILLKPNFVYRVRLRRPAVTHPEVILAMARLVREAGGKPVIGDSPSIHSSQTVAEANGLAPQAAKENIPIITLKKMTHRRLEVAGRKYRLPVSAEAMEFDGIINLPKFKAHRQATLTFSVKNLYGCVPGKRKAARHFTSGGDLDWFSNMLVANATILNPRINIVDGIIAMEGEGPVKGNPRPMGVLAAGVDPTAVDSVCCRLVKFPPTSLCTIQAARRMGIGAWAESDIELIGDPLDEFVVEDFDFPDLMPIFFSFPRLVRSTLRSWRQALAPEGSAG